MACAMASTSAVWSFHRVRKSALPPELISFHLVSATADGLSHQVAIFVDAQSIGWIDLHCLPPSKARVARVAVLPDDLCSFQGIYYATQLAKNVFRCHAVSGVEQFGRPLGEAYRRHLEYEYCRLCVEWSLLIHDVETSPPTTQDRFVQHLLQLCTYLDHDGQDDLRKLTCRSLMEAWKQQVQERCRAKDDLIKAWKQKVQEIYQADDDKSERFHLC
ncbi:hypothetical protein F4808DRAFT_465399 [Astrocystis sublimbata]|nr:hypothetical protein F4808DRAFT_465399 [Astrocystis sublimbata]